MLQPAGYLESLLTVRAFVSTKNMMDTTPRDRWPKDSDMVDMVAEIDLELAHEEIDDARNEIALAEGG